MCMDLGVCECVCVREREREREREIERMCVSVCVFVCVCDIRFDGASVENSTLWPCQCHHIARYFCMHLQ